MEKNESLKIEETFNLALKNHQDGKTDIALKLYNQILKINPKHSSALNNLGIILINLGENQKAKDCYEKIIGIDPNNADAYNNLGVIYKELRENQKAKDCYERAIEINPNYVSAYNNLGAIFNELRENQKAKDCYERAIKIHPNYSDAHYNLGNIFKELGEYQKAKDCYERAIEINPNYVRAYNNLGLIFSELRDSQKAKDCYERAIEIDPNYADAYYFLGNIFTELGEYQKVKGCYEKAIELDHNNTRAHNLLLRYLYEANNQSALFKKLDSITKEGKINAVIGSIFSRAQVKYAVKKENPFCNNPLDYVLKTDLIEKCDFKNIIVDCVQNILKNDSISNKEQELITNGYQTAGNLFTNENFNTKEIQRIINAEIENYRLKFKNSKEGFIKNWPNNYILNGWLVSLKKGGKLNAHMHELGWLSGSIYVNVPPKLKADSGNLVVCIDENENEKSIDVVSGSLCLFPSSLLHYTIPFESEEERIVLAFDVTPN